MNYCFYSILFKLKTYMTYMFNNVFDKMLLFVELSVLEVHLNGKAFSRKPFFCLKNAKKHPFVTDAF
jgi:hypothetical protein